MDLVKPKYYNNVCILFLFQDHLIIILKELELLVHQLQRMKEVLKGIPYIINDRQGIIVILKRIKFYFQATNNIFFAAFICISLTARLCDFGGNYESSQQCV